MKPFNLTTALIVIILALLVYLALKPDGSSATIEIIKQQNKELTDQLKANQVLTEKQIKEIKLIEKKETIIRNYYNEIINSADTLTTDISAIANIRKWLDSLGTARLD